MRRIVARFIPRPVKDQLRRAYRYLEHDVGVRTGRYDPLIPSSELHSVGDTDFAQTGEEFFRHFVDLGGLQSNERVLDVGCGTGRMARPLTKYLTRGTYDGIDIVLPSIKWCRRTYARRFPNFRFHFTDIYNKAYNPTGSHKASGYRFPFETASFDFVFLTSVFTHMLPQDMENYFSEITRVLKVGGRCFITYFLLNPDSLKLIEDGASSLDFKYEFSQGCRVVNQAIPEYAVSYEESRVRELHQRHKVSILEPIRYGTWNGRNNGLSYQDILIASKSSD